MLNSLSGESSTHKATAGLALLVLLFFTVPARGHGRFPAAGLVALAPTDGQQIVARIREAPGVVVSRDGGNTWRWICPEAIGIDAETDPPAVITKNGTIIAATFNGLTVSSDRCA